MTAEPEIVGSRDVEDCRAARDLAIHAAKRAESAADSAAFVMIVTLVACYVAYKSAQAIKIIVEDVMSNRG